MTHPLHSVRAVCDGLLEVVDVEARNGIVAAWRGGIEGSDKDLARAVDACREQVSRQGGIVGAPERDVQVQVALAIHLRDVAHE